MENEIYEKDYGEEFRERSDKSEGKDFLDTLMEVGFFQKYQEEMDKIPKRVVPKEKADYDKLKELYMARRIAEMVHGQVDVFISFGSGDKVIQKKFKEFDAEVKENNAYVYEKSGEFSGMLRLLRKFGLRFYSLIVRLSKVRNG